MSSDFCLLHTDNPIEVRFLQLVASIIRRRCGNECQYDIAVTCNDPTLGMAELYDQDLNPSQKDSPEPLNRLVKNTSLLEV